MVQRQPVATNKGLGLVGAKAAGQDAKGARRSQRQCFGRARPGSLPGGGVRGAPLDAIARDPFTARLLNGLRHSASKLSVLNGFPHKP